MNARSKSLYIILGGVLWLSACGGPAAPTESKISQTQVVAAPSPRATATRLVEPATSTSKPPTAPIPTKASRFKVVTATPDQLPSVFPLANRGPYLKGYRTYTFIDESRGREVSITAWYPAQKQTDAQGRQVVVEAAPDMSGAPYPLILSSTKVARNFAETLVSHGFTWVSVDNIDTYSDFDEEWINQVLDILFALEKAGSNSLEGLEGVIDAEHAGVTGYSFDGANALTMSGVRVDPPWYQQNCATDPNKPFALSAYSCDPARRWEEFVAQFGENITIGDDGMWQPLTDERIRAALPMAGEGWWLFGERGLAASDRPAMFFNAENDTLYPENAMIYEHLGTPDKVFITFKNRDHMMILDPKSIEEMAHFMAAFFGYYLQGREDYQLYFSQDFVKQFEDLTWGVKEE